MNESATANKTASNESVLLELKHFMDIPIKITIQLASRTMKVRDILQLHQDSIVELPKSAGENVDILMNKRLVAFGEILELEGSTGIRITDLNVLT